MVIIANAMSEPKTKKIVVGPACISCRNVASLKKDTNKRNTAITIDTAKTDNTAIETTVNVFKIVLYIMFNFVGGFRTYLVKKSNPLYPNLTRDVQTPLEERPERLRAFSIRCCFFASNTDLSDVKII